MTNHETAAVDRIPLARSVAYAVKGVPDVPAEHTKGLTLAPTEITLTYRSTTDSQLGRVHAYVKGWWMRNGERYPTEKPMGQHYYGGPDGWPEWLAEEARLHDPEPAVSVPPPAPRADDQAALRDRIAEALLRWAERGNDPQYASMRRPETVRANAYSRADAVLAVLPEPADRAAALNEGADAVFALDYDAMVGEEGDENLGSMREAWDLGTIHAEKLLRRLADEAAVVPPPALTEEGRLRAQVEVLQQDAERDQGLAKVGARCMRDGHQGLIEQGRLVLEGWRFALSTALDLGTGAPWEAIHERVKELTAAVSGPCVAGEQQNETPEAEVVHACPPDGSGLTPCCGRTPFELPRTDRISSEPDAVTCAPVV